jgi:hypothetical protein
MRPVRVRVRVKDRVRVMDKVEDRVRVTDGVRAVTFFLWV